DAFDDLLGAYALDALDAAEAAAVEEFLAVHPEREGEIERLRAAAAWYGASETEAPPPRLRAAILRRLQPRVAVPGLAAHEAATALRATASRGEPMHFFGSDRSASDLLCYRAFETWIHAGDIVVARGGDRPGLPPAAFGVMAEASMALLPGCMAVRHLTRPGE